MTIRSAGLVLFSILTVAASSAAGQQPVTASDTALGDAWRPAAAADATRPQGGLAVDIRFDLLRRASATGGVLTLPLPDGDTVRMSVKWTQSDAAQTLVAGPMLGVDGEASLTAVGDVLVGRIVANGRLFTVRRPTGSSAHVVSEVDQSARRPFAEPLVPQGATESAPVPFPDAPRDTNQFVDVLAVYTPAARAESGGTSNIIAELVAAINSSNVALANSAVTHRFRLVHYREIAYVEDGIGDTSLRRVTNPADGYMDDVPLLRNQYRADLVALLTNDVDVCGIGWLMGPSGVGNTSFQSAGYSVSVWDCANRYLALAHEMGHNMGLHHDRPWAGGTPAFPYAYGWAVSGVARDIMAYEYSCSPSCPTRTIFSTPLFNFPGTGVPAGTANEDNARALNGTSQTVANFRQSVCALTVATGSASFASGGGTGSVTVNTGDPFCTWSPTSSNTAFVTITSGPGTGNGVVNYVVAPNNGLAARTAILTVEGQTVTIFQAGRNNVGDADGDGRSEIAVYRPSNGGWHLLKSGTSFTVGGSYSWGAGSDLPLTGDFDGDGKNDLVVFRPPTGHWFVLKSSTNFTTSDTYQWGTGGDKPVAADYDGDGRTDLAIYRPSNGTWYIRTSSTGYSGVLGYSWGASSDLPVPGDYDGDLRADLVVYRPGSGHWFVLKSSSGYSASDTYQWGTPGDIAVPGNYDGDTRSDIAIYRPSTGTWYALTSSTSFTSGFGYVWGASSDIPVPADYDGDGRTDLAVYRSSTAHWFILKSTTSFTLYDTYQWGSAGDIPVLRR